MKRVNTGGRPLPAMTVGTVQLGMDYGIANESGKPDEAKSFAILRTAFGQGALSLDTSPAYGDSEEIIGRFLKTWEGERPYITTKVPVLRDPSGDFGSWALASAERSLRRLGVDRLDCLLLHGADNLYGFGEKAAAAMEQILHRGYADRVGVSLYTAGDIEAMLRYPVFTATQIPMSIFDQRLIAGGYVRRLSDAGFAVFVRSVFLQGVFFLDPDRVTDPILVKEAVPAIRLIRRITEETGMTVPELAISFIRDTPGVSSLVLGADDPDQVLENASCLAAPPLPETVREQLEQELSGVNIPEIMKVLSRPKEKK